MKIDVLNYLLRYAGTVEEPENLFSGKRLSPNFAPPDNILVFFHNFTAPAPNSHGRCTFVFPLDRMIYYLDRSRLELFPGQVLFVPPYATRFLHPASEGYRRLFVTFDDPGRQEYLPPAGINLVPDGNWKPLLRFLQSYRSGRMLECELALMRFLLHLHSASEDGAAAHSLPDSIEKAIEFIENNLSKRIGIKEIADKVGLSESHLRCRFRQEMKVSLGRYLARKRLDAAQYLLLHSAIPLTEVAIRSGFANVFVFSAFFKKNTGISPLKYRRGRS